MNPIYIHAEIKPKKKKIYIYIQSVIRLKQFLANLKISHSTRGDDRKTILIRDKSEHRQYTVYQVFPQSCTFENENDYKVSNNS